MLKNILGKEMYLESIGTLVNSVIEIVLDRIFSMEALPNDETYQLEYLLRQMMEFVHRAFSFKQANGTAKLEPIAKYVAFWEKFLAVLTFLKQSTIHTQDEINVKYASLSESPSVSSSSSSHDQNVVFRKSDLMKLLAIRFQ